jgi:hypothetical protein
VRFHGTGIFALEFGELDYRFPHGHGGDDGCRVPGFCGASLPRKRVNEMSWLPLNFALMRNPLNWLIITLMVILPGMALALVFHPSNGEES